MKKIFKISSIKMVISTIFFMILCLIGDTSSKKEIISKTQFQTYIILLVLLVVLFMLNIKLPKILGGIVYALLPIGSFLLVEWAFHDPFVITNPIKMLNLAFYYIIYLILLFLIGNSRISGIVSTVFALIMGTANYFVMSFRGSPILPWDLKSIGTATAVAGNYEFTCTFQILIIFILYLLLIILADMTDIKIKINRYRWICLGTSVAMMAEYLIYVRTDDIRKRFDLAVVLCMPEGLYNYNGFALSYTMNMKSSDMDKPEGYSKSAIEEITDKYPSDDTSDFDIQEKPNIIVIMNESFSDLAVNFDFDTNMDYMPFIRSLDKNTIKGNAYVSVKGGNTANSEYEFLTSNSFSIIPSGTIAYQGYVNENSPSIVGQLDRLGYHSIATHPYMPTAWGRQQVYDDLGFDEKYFLDSFMDREMIRGYISDKGNYEFITSLYENKEPDERYFFFDVTMQNHGGYGAYEGFNHDVTLEGYDNADQTNQYLSLIKQSDSAFEYLVDYFKDLDEPTIILMFGDHQPMDSVVAPIYELNDTYNSASVEQEQRRFITPYVMWANYELPLEQKEEISLNYLGAYLLENAGIPLTGYQKYLKDLSKELPVLSGMEIKDAEGNSYLPEDPTYSDLLGDYEMLQYNMIFDLKNRVDGFFTVEPVE